MAKIIIYDIFDELKAENKRLFYENKVISSLLEKYRNISLNFQNFCVCKQNSTNIFNEINSIENEYKTIVIKGLNSSKVNEDFDKSHSNLVFNKVSENVSKTSKVNTNESNDENNEGNTQSSDQSFEPKRAKRSYVRRKPLKGSSKKRVVSNGVKCSKVIDKKHSNRVIKKSENVSKTTIVYKNESNDESNEEVSKSESEWEKDSFNESFEDISESSFDSFEPKRDYFRKESEQQKYINICQYCNEQFDGSISLQTHITAIHNECKAYKCVYKECNQLSKTIAEKYEHQKVDHNWPGIQCDIDGCLRFFSNLGNFKYHKRVDHNGGLWLCEWDGCYKSYETSESYRRHKISHSIQTENKNYKKPFKCDVNECNKMFRTKRDLCKHKTYHFKKFACTWPDCEERFQNRLAYLGHLNKHKNLRPFICDYEDCDKGFYSEKLKRIHYKNFHFKNGRPRQQPKDQVYKCDKCVFETEFEAIMESHITRFHPNVSELVVKCTFEGCSQMFKTKKRMKDHYKDIHNPNPPIKCDWPGCDFTHGKPYLLKRHKLIHIGARTFKCDFEGCPKSFVTESTQRNHRLTHLKKYVCSWPGCEHRFTSIALLTAHTNTHLNVRPFKCYISECNKDFKTDRHMKSHIRNIHKLEPNQIQREDN